ncbi:MAG: tRNA (5-methylaminomethyl-2-thiouridine)(34)-methyltransferase MnmD [Mariniblastus sp.]|nr:tRNA (5-methylaminomethyl-2-thiouridine)(34)-methyltransferase MnmD [Mariniblastus sp.]
MVTDDGSRTLLDSDSSLAWHSESGALAESRHVYLDNSGVNQRLQQGKVTRVLEIGFGTGLCFWLTASAACRGKAQLDYTSFEHRLMPATVLAQLNHGEIGECQPAYDRFSTLILDSPDLATGELSCRVDSVSLNLVTRDVTDTTKLPGALDAVFHDPFSPEATPEMWSQELFVRLFGQLKPQGRLVTYCVKSSIQRLLGHVGFEVSKKKGPPGGKREVLVATRPG